MKWRLLGAVVVTLLFVYYLLPNINGNLLLAKFKEISLPYLVLGFTSLLMANVIRSVRFRTMAVYGGSFTQWWHINQTYNVLTTLLPGGGGEVATAYLMKVTSDSRETLALGIRTLIFNRLMDLFFYSALLFATANLLLDVSEYAPLAIGAGLIFLVIAWLALTPAVEKRTLDLVDKYLAQKFTILTRFRVQLTQLINISDVQHNQGKIKLALVQSFLLVLAAASSVYFTMLSLEMEITWYQGFYCMGLFALFQLIPIQGLAGIGTQAAWWTYAITAAGYRGSEVITLGIMLYAIFLSFVVIMFIPSGLYFMFKRYGKLPAQL